jgi:transposase
LFGVSDQQVRRIVYDACNDKPSASTNQRGAKSKLTTDFITSILLLLEETPSTTLKKLAKHVKSKFNIQVTTAAIQKTLKTIEVTWKTVTPIPRKWNEAAFLQQRHDYVLNCVTNVGQKLIFVDESGFNSETRPLHGYALSGKSFFSTFFYFTLIDSLDSRTCGCFEDKRVRKYDQSYWCNG